MRKIDPIWLIIFSDLLVNLAAGWFGAVVILPTIFQANTLFDFIVLTLDILGGIVSLLVAFRLRKLAIR